MSPTVVVADPTRAGTVEQPSRDRLFGDRSDVASSVPDELLERGRARLRNQQGMAAVQRTALLGVLLANLENVPFEAIGSILNVKPNRLEKMMHGEESIPSHFVNRWTLVAEMLADLHSVVKRNATWRWLNLSIAALGEQTPLEVIITARGPVQMREFVRKYTDESFT